MVFRANLMKVTKQRDLPISIWISLNKKSDMDFSQVPVQSQKPLGFFFFLMPDYKTFKYKASA